MSDILWQPDAKRIGKTRMEAFRRFVNQRHHLKIDDYPAPVSYTHLTLPTIYSV